MGGDHKRPSTFKITKKEDLLFPNMVFKVFEFLSEVCAIYVPQSGNYFRPITNMKTGPKNHLICLSRTDKQRIFLENFAIRMRYFPQWYCKSKNHTEFHLKKFVERLDISNKTLKKS